MESETWFVAHVDNAASLENKRLDNNRRFAMFGLKLLRRPANRAVDVVRTLAFSKEELKAIEEQAKARNAFKIFKLEERLKIDERKLKREMHKLQRAFHPDKIASTGLEQTNKTNHLSTMINQCYQTLKDPYKRARYLLEVRLNKSPDDIETALDGLKMDPEFLDRMMDLRERIARESNLALIGLAQEVESELETIITEIDKDFHTENYNSVLKNLGKLQFLANCSSSLKDKIGDDV